MKDKYIPELVMSVLDKRRAYYCDAINTPFTSFTKDSFATQLSYLREVLEDIFGEEK